MTYGIDEAREGRFQAVFANGADAAGFFARLAGEPDGFYAQDVKINRKGGRIVTWTVAADRIAGTEDWGEPRWISYWTDLAETVGHYGSTFGEYPNGAGKRTAYLNGRPGTAVM